MDDKQPNKVIVEKDSGFSDKLDLMKFTSDVHSRIKNDITADFIFAKLNDVDKEGIINMTVNAFSSKRLLYVYANKLKGEDKEMVKKIGDAVFDNFMTKVYMIITLNRNIDDNYIINVLSGYGNMAEDITPELEPGAINKVKDRLKNEERR